MECLKSETSNEFRLNEQSKNLFGISSPEIPNHIFTSFILTPEVLSLHQSIFYPPPVELGFYHAYSAPRKKRRRQSASSVFRTNPLPPSAPVWGFRRRAIFHRYSKSIPAGYPRNTGTNTWPLICAGPRGGRAGGHSPMTTIFKPCMLMFISMASLISARAYLWDSSSSTGRPSFWASFRNSQACIQSLAW